MNKTTMLILSMFLLSLPIIVIAVPDWQNDSKAFYYDAHNDSTINDYWTRTNDNGIDTKTWTEGTSYLRSYIQDNDNDGRTNDVQNITSTINIYDYYNIKQNTWISQYNSGGAQDQDLIYYLKDSDTELAINTITKSGSGTTAQWYNYTIYWNDSNHALSIIEENGVNSSIDLSTITTPYNIKTSQQIDDNAEISNSDYRIYDTSIYSNETINLRLTLNTGTNNFTVIEDNKSSNYNDVHEIVQKGTLKDRVIISYNNQSYESTTELLPQTNTIATLTPTTDCYLGVNVFGGGDSLSDAQVMFSTITGFLGYYVTETKLTDVTGYTLIPLKNHYYYRYIVRHPDYTSQTYYYNAECGVDRTINIYMNTGIVTLETRLSATHEYNNDTGFIYVNWTHPDGTNVTAETRIIRHTITGDANICRQVVTDTARGLKCNVTAYPGSSVTIRINRTGIIDYGSNEVIDSTRIKNYISKGEGALWAFFIMIVVAGFGLFSPVGAVITSIVGLLFIAYLGLFSPITTTFIIIAAVLGIAIGVKIRT